MTETARPLNLLLLLVMLLIELIGECEHSLPHQSSQNRTPIFDAPRLGHGFEVAFGKDEAISRAEKRSVPSSYLISRKRSVARPLFPQADEANSWRKGNGNPGIGAPKAGRICRGSWIEPFEKYRVIRNHKIPSVVLGAKHSPTTLEQQVENRRKHGDHHGKSRILLNPDRDESLINPLLHLGSQPGIFRHRQFAFFQQLLIRSLDGLAHHVIDPSQPSWYSAGVNCNQCNQVFKFCSNRRSGTVDYPRDYGHRRTLDECERVFDLRCFDLPRRLSNIDQVEVCFLRGIHWPSAPRATIRHVDDTKLPVNCAVVRPSSKERLVDIVVFARGAHYHILAGHLGC